MMEQNENLPEIERLKHEEFNLDTEEQKSMQAQQDKAIQEVCCSFRVNRSFSIAC